MAKITLKSRPIHTCGQLPKVGEKAPDFTHLVDSNLEEFSLKDFPGKKILCIVPSLDTEVCSLSAKKFNQAISTHPQLCVLLISADLPFAQNRVCTHNNLKNIKTLSLVRSRDFAQNYGVLIVDGPLAGLCARAIVVLDANNIVLHTELVAEITQEPDYEKALQVALA